MNTSTNKEPCSVHWCKPRLPCHEIRLKSISGDCLEKVGIPSRAKAVIDKTAKPVVGDLVWCNNEFCSIGGYIKRVEEFDGEHMRVGTAYRDPTRDFHFDVFEFYGVVMYVFDTFGDVVYRREQS